MSSGIRSLGLREERPPPAPRPERRGSTPPFRRGHGARRAGKAAGRVAPGAFSGLSRGGTVESLVGDTRRRRVTGAGVSAAFHLLLLLVLLGGFVPTGAEDRTLAAPPEEDSLLYAFEAPPLAETTVEAVPLPEPAPEPPPAEPPPEEAPVGEDASPPPPAIVIPKAQIAAPNTGFQNDLPFSEGNEEEFFIDREMGDDPEAESAEPDGGPEPEPAPEAPVPEAAATEPGAALDAPEAPPLLFDQAAFRERIRDPAAAARRRGDELARAKARAAAEAERRRRGTPTDIWRFLEGKRFRNPEGGLVSNRNNTLYYDDRGANLVPWIGRLIAEVRRNWYIPYAATYDRGHVAIAISVLRSGEIAWLQVVVPSGVAGFDNAAVGALRGAQLLPLPDDYPGADFEIMLVFWYNERPYDLFSATP